MIRRSISLVSILLAATAVTACTGGGRNVLPAPSAPSQSGGGTSGTLSKATFTLTIAHANAATAAARSPKYISTNTQSVSISVANGNATPGPATVVNVTPGSANCTSSANGTTCTIAVPAPPGTDTFTVSLYSAQNAGGSVLATSTVRGTVTSGAANSIPIALGGVVATLALSLPATPATGGTAATIPLTIVAKDASGATIVGAEPFATPIALTDSDTSGSTSLSTTTLTSPSTAVTLNYTGTYVSSPVTISGTSANVTVAPASFLNTATNIYIGDHASPNVYVFPAASSGTVTPSALVSQEAASSTYAANSVVGGLTTDAAGNTYVLYNLSDGNTTSFSDIGVFGAGARGTVAPARTIGGPSATATLLDPGSSDIAVDAAGKIYVDGTGSGPGANMVLVFPAGATTNTPPAYTLNANAGGIAVTPSGTLFVSLAGNSISEYAPGASGNAATLASITGIHAGILALDTAGNVYSGSNATPPAVNEYTVSGNTITFARSITNATAITVPQPVAVDQAGYIYVGNETQNGTISVFAPTASGTATPLRTIVSATTPIVPAQLTVGR